MPKYRAKCSLYSRNAGYFVYAQFSKHKQTNFDIFRENISKNLCNFSSSTRNSANDLQSKLTRLALEIGNSVDPGLLLTGDSLPAPDPTPESTIDLGNALKLLADKRQKMEDTQRLIAEAQLRQAEVSLQNDQKIEDEKSR